MTSPDGIPTSLLRVAYGQVRLDQLSVALVALGHLSTRNLFEVEAC